MSPVDILKPTVEITRAIQHPEDFGLPSHLARHVQETTRKVEAQSTRSQLEKLIKAAKDPQIAGTLISLAVGLATTAYAERQNLALNNDVFNYGFSLLDFYINPTDTADTLPTTERMSRVAAFLSKLGVVGFGGAEFFQLRSFKKSIEDGVAPCPYQGHMVGIGFQDPLLFAEDDAGASFVKRAREIFGQIVPVQAGHGFYNPSELGTPLNDKGYYANLSALNDGTPQAEMIEHILVSGAYKAESLVINAQREHELFEEIIIDQTIKKDERPDLAMAGNFLHNTLALRQAVTQLKEPPKTTLILPMHMRQKAHDHSAVNGLEPWARSALANFGRDDTLLPGVEGIIIPEKLFLEGLAKEIKQRDLADATIYIDTEGQADAEGKAERCKQALQEVLGSQTNIITTPPQAGEASVCVMLRQSNRHFDGSSQVNQHRLKHNFTFYPATTRHDVVQHVNDSDQQTRIPILYKQAIADEVLKLSRGENSKFSISELQKTEALPKQ